MREAPGAAPGAGAAAGALGAPDGIALRNLKRTLRPAVEERQLREDLAFLKGLDLIEPHGHGRGSYWVLRREAQPGRID